MNSNPDSAYSSPQLYSEGRFRHITNTVSEFQATASEGLEQGPNVAVRAGMKPAILRSQGIESTKEPPRPYMIATVYSGTESYNTPAYVFYVYYLFLEFMELHNINYQSMALDSSERTT